MPTAKRDERRQALRAEVLRVIGDEKLTAAELGERIGVEPRRLSATLATMYQRGELRREIETVYEPKRRDLSRWYRTQNGGGRLWDVWR